MLSESFNEVLVSIQEGAVEDFNLETAFAQEGAQIEQPKREIWAHQLLFSLVLT